MSTLDERLQTILYDMREDISPGWSGNTIRLIHAAFQDAGYIPPSEVEKWQKSVNVLADSFNSAMQLPTKQYVALDKTQQQMNNLLTGREWYDKLHKELSNEVLAATTDVHNFAWRCVDVMEAARRSAGLQDA